MSDDRPSGLDLDGALELLMDPVTGSTARGKTVEGIVTIHVDDALMTGSTVFVKQVVAGLRRDFKVGTEDINDVMFVGQRIRWLDKGKANAQWPIPNGQCQNANAIVPSHHSTITPKYHNAIAPQCHSTIMP